MRFNLFSQLKDLFLVFVRSESFSGALLLTLTFIAVVWENSQWASSYDYLTGSGLKFWVNDGLMSVFFLLVGLEIKREIWVGELSSFKKAALPILVALGGMIVPGLIFIAVNHHSSAYLKAWAVPVATDIAFAMGVLCILGRRIPKNLMVFLAAIAIADDLGAIIVIAIFYTQTLSWLFLGLSGLIFLVLLTLNFLKIRSLWIYLLLGLLLWWTVEHSGVHSTIAGVLLAMMIPAEAQNNLLEKLERILLAPVNYGIVPLFVLLNAGVDLSDIGHGISPILTSTLTLGVFLGLLIGKPIGIYGTTWLLTRSKLCVLPVGVNMRLVFGMSLLAGIGFTMSIFISGLSFPGNGINLLDCKLGIFGASVGSAFLGLGWLGWVTKSSNLPK